MNEYNKDEQILKKLAGGDNNEWKQLYENLKSPFQLYFLKSTGMDIETIEELYQDALVILYRKVKSGALQAPLQSSLKTYLFGVGKLIYRKKRGEKLVWDDQIPDQSIQADIETIGESQHQAQLVSQLLGKLDENCRLVLELVYLKGYAMESVAQTLGLPSEGAARKKKYDCLKKLRALMNK